MSKRACLCIIGLAVVLSTAACGSSGAKKPAAAPTTATTVAAGTTTSSSSQTSVTDQPATTAAAGVGAGSPLGSTQSVTTSDGHALGVRVVAVTASSATQVQVEVQFTADGPPSQVQPASDLHLVDTTGASHGVSLVDQPAGCPALAATVSVTAQAPVSGCVVFALAAGVTPAEVTFVASGAPASSAVAWKAG